MSKYIVELFDGVQVLTGVGASPSGTIWSKSYDVDELEELNNDYINENFGELRDEAYRKGYDDGKDSFSKGCEGCRYTSKKSHEEPCFSCTRNHMDQYEPMPKQDDRIEVGDIVKVYGNIGVVTYTYENTFNVMMCDGSTGDWEREDLKKTGRHYDISGVLEAIQL